MSNHFSITITLDRYSHSLESAAGKLANLVDAIGRNAAETGGANPVT